MHTTLEEEIFYPAVREAIEDEDLMNEAAVEHETAKMLIEQLENMGPDDPNYFATFTVLGEYVRHHIKEEQGEMFPAARKAGLDLEALGERMRARAGGDRRVRKETVAPLVRASGSTSVKVLPSPGSLASLSSPPSSRVSSRLIDRPRPVPPYWRLVRAVGLLEGLEDQLLLVRRDADAGVGDRERDAVPAAVRRDAQA